MLNNDKNFPCDTNNKLEMDKSLDLEIHVEPNKMKELKKQIEKRLFETRFDSAELVRLATSSKNMSTIVEEIALSNRDMIDEAELADKITHEITNDIEKKVDDHLRNYPKYTLTGMNSANDVTKTTSNFFNLISLLRDVSVVGRKLLEAVPRFEMVRLKSAQFESSSMHSDSSDNKDVNSNRSVGLEDATSNELLAALIESSSSDDFLVLTSSLDSITIREMMLTVHLLIKSHECFTLSHDTHGVVKVLRRTKFMILNILAPKNQMELITKLLTSIGRYREMNYVFDLFRDRNQFELLLSKGVERTPDLRIALFNYVKSNPEFYALVTLNFSMFREIAESLEANATKQLDRFLSNHVDNKELDESRQLQRSQSKKEKKINYLCIDSSEDGVSFESNRMQLQAQERLHQQQNQPLGQHLHGSSSQAAVLSAAGRHESVLSSTSTTSIIESPSLVAQQEQASSWLGEVSKTVTSNLAASDDDCDKRDSLNVCLVELVDASDCYAKAGCYKRSNHCANQAKLIALQLALLPDKLSVLKLQQSQLADIIVSFDSFANAYIVAEAYNYHLAWRQALFKNVILGAGQSYPSSCSSPLTTSSRYFEDYCKRFDLSATLVSELVFMYKQHTLRYEVKSAKSTPKTTTNKKKDCSSPLLEAVGNEHSTSDDAVGHYVVVAQPATSYNPTRLANAMKMVISRLADVESKYKTFTQLNFLDSRDELLRDPATQAYLKDLRL